MKDNILRITQISSQKIAGQWWFKREVIDKWTSEESLERLTENIKASSKKRAKGK